MGSTLSMSSSYHPQSDGQTERFNSMLEEYLRHFVTGSQKNWVKLLDAAQLCFNSQKCSTTNKSPFEIVTGQQPLLPHTIDSEQSVKSLSAKKFSEEWRQNLEIARSYLTKAQKRMKKQADKGRRLVEFKEGDLVMVKAPNPLLTKCVRGRDPRFLQKYIGPCPIKKRIGKVAYRIELPRWWKTHNVLHVSQLKAYTGTPEDVVRYEQIRPQRPFGKMVKQVAEAILDHRVAQTKKREIDEYLVKWQGCSEAENTWERATDVKALKPLVEEYWKSRAPRTSPSQVGENVDGRASARPIQRCA